MIEWTSLKSKICHKTDQVVRFQDYEWEASIPFTPTSLPTNSLRIRALTPSAEVVREKVQDGLTGETREIQYTQCKIVGNGSFGVVFQTKLSPSGEDAAIKRVLQDKRFKVRDSCAVKNVMTDGSRIENCRL